MQIHNLIQGSPEWQIFRLDHDGASESAAMLGISPKVKRNELLRMKHTGTPKEFSDWVQENILDYGHEVEALARPIVEAMIGEDLYAVTCSDGIFSVSCDGLTIGGDISWEHKQWAEKLAASVAAGILPDEHIPQCQQNLMVTGAQKLIFTVSDGTPEKMVHMDVFPDQEWFKRIKAGWEQFGKDLAEYVPEEVMPAVVAAPTLNLPAVSVQVKGSIALISNLDLFGDALKDFISRIPEKPSTDQEFADCKSAIGKLQDAQDALDAAEANALGQIATFDEMRRTKALYFELARTTRLSLEKLVTAREAAIKVEITQGGKDKLAEHIASLNTRLGKPYMPVIVADFATAIKNKRTVASLQNAVDTLLSQKKIEANAVADKIQINLTTLRELAVDYKFLFSDADQIVLKANDDLTSLVKLRIAEHKAAEEKRLAAERARIAEEERIKAEAKAKAEHEAQMRAQAAEAARQQAERDAVIAGEAKAAREAQEAAQAEAKRITDAANAEAERVRLQTATEQMLIDARPILNPAAAWPAPVVVAARQSDLVAKRPAVDNRPPITTGALCALAGDGCSITAAFIQALGINPADRPKDAKSGTYWAAADVPVIFAALARHFEQLATTDNAIAA